MDARPPYLIERGPGYFEYQLPISVKLVVDYHGKVPLLRNERDEWELPGGKLEVGESPESGLRREVAEELGITVSDIEIVDTWVYRITSVRHVFIVSYGAVYHGSQILTPSSEHKELGVFSYEESTTLPMPEPYRETIRRWRRRVAETACRGSA